jgi:hypothetical protein
MKYYKGRILKRHNHVLGFYLRMNDYGIYIGDRILSKYDYDSYKNFGYKDIMENIGLGYILRGCSNTNHRNRINQARRFD